MPKCSFGGDIANDCKDCAYGIDYHYDSKTDECVRREHMEANAFVVYGSLGQPLAYFFKAGSDEFTEVEMSTIMKLFPEAKDNDEIFIEWREDV